MLRSGPSASATRPRARSRRPPTSLRRRPSQKRLRSPPKPSRPARACATACAAALDLGFAGMRRSLTWLVAVPLLLVSSQAAHFVAYRVVYPGTPFRTQVLLGTGHGYLDRLPIAFGAAGAIALVALLVAAFDASRGHAARALPPWAFGMLAPAAFVIQEFLERSLHSGTFAWHTAAAPTFLPGLAAQVPLALLAWLAARLLLRMAVHAGRALAVQPPRTAPAPPSFLCPAPPETPRARVLAWSLAERGPPHFAAV